MSTLSCIQWPIQETIKSHASGLSGVTNLFPPTKMLILYARPLFDIETSRCFYSVRRVSIVATVRITICRDCPARQHSGITAATHSNHNRHNYLNYSLHCRYHTLLWINNASCISVSNFIFATVGWCSPVEDTPLSTRKRAEVTWNTVEGEGIYFLNVNKRSRQSSFNVSIPFSLWHQRHLSSLRNTLICFLVDKATPHSRLHAKYSQQPVSLLS